MDLAQHLPVIWRRRRVVLGASLLVAAAVLAFSSSRPKVFRAEAVVRAPAGLQSSGARAGEETLFLARTYAALATTRPVVADAMSRSGLRLDVDRAMGRVSATSDGEVGFISLAATGPSRASAIALAQGLTDALVAAVVAQRAGDREVALTPLRVQIAALETQLANLGDDDARSTSSQIRYAALLQALAEEESQVVDRPAVVNPARADDAPVSPNPRRDTVLALMAALVVNAELAVFVEARSDRFPRTDPADEVKRVTGLPVLAEVPNDDVAGASEAFNSLRTNLLFIGTSQHVRSVIVTSVGPAAGKSYCAIGLARSAADLEMSVTLVDADLRRPALHTRLGRPRSPGLSERLSGQAASELASVEGHRSLRVLPAGAAVADPSAMLTSWLGSVLADLPAELVVVDSPPASLFADALAMALQCDASIVVVDVASTRRSDVRRLVDDLRRVGGNPLGVVLNKVARGSRSAYYYGEAERQGADTPPTHAGPRRRSRPTPSTAKPPR